MEPTIETWNLEACKEFAKATKEVLILGKTAKIRKLPFSYLTGVKQEDTNSMLELIVRGLVEPQLSIEILKEMPIEFINATAKEIAEFNGISGKDAEKN